MIRSSACPLRQADPAQSGRHGDRKSYTTPWDIIASRVWARTPVDFPDHAASAGAAKCCEQLAGCYAGLRGEDAKPDTKDTQRPGKERN